MGDKRLNRIITRTGDTGSTGLADGTRLPKAHLRVAAMGDIDELNSLIGLLCVTPALNEAAHVGVRERVRAVQHDLFDLGGELSLPGATVLSREATKQLETDAAQWNSTLPALQEFVLPGSNEAGARAHLARAVCRRAERTLWQLHALEPVDPALTIYLNRLSDWLFVLARVVARHNGGSEFTWQRAREASRHQ